MFELLKTKPKYRQTLSKDNKFYTRVQNGLNYLISGHKSKADDKTQMANAFTEPMIEFYYQQACLDYTVGKPIDELLISMDKLIQYTKDALFYLENHYNLLHPHRPMKLNALTQRFDSEMLSNLLGLCILFERKDWLKVIVEAVDLEKKKRVNALDSLIAMKIPDYPITKAKMPEAFTFREPLYQAIQAQTEEETLAFLEDYLCRWYDGLHFEQLTSKETLKRVFDDPSYFFKRSLHLRMVSIKAREAYIDSNLWNKDIYNAPCCFYGYWCFEAAAVAYLKNIDDSRLHRFIYYPKDMIEYARAKKGEYEK